MTPALEQEMTDRLLEAARAAAANAYAPHSNYRVGAALLTSSGEIIAGCNVENASYGLSMCAERCAIFVARSRLLIDPNKLMVLAVAISSSGGAMPWPCGACRQVLREFADEKTPVIVQGSEGIRQVLLGELLPHAFRMQAMP